MVAGLHGEDARKYFSKEQQSEKCSNVLPVPLTTLACVCVCVRGFSVELFNFFPPNSFYAEELFSNTAERRE